MLRISLIFLCLKILCLQIIIAQYTSIPRIPCVERYTNSRGECDYYYNCYFAQYAYEYRRISPTICGYINRYPVVCCPRNNQQQVEQTTEADDLIFNEPSSSGSTSSNQAQSYGMRISERKCLEYKANVVKKIPTYTLSVVPQKIETEVTSCEVQNPLIINGKEAAPGEFPHMAAVGWLNEQRNGYSWRCGGSLISENFVLTAAHCTLSRENIEPEVVRLGDHNLKDSSDQLIGQTIRISQIIKHESYKGVMKYYDIALFRLAASPTINKFVRPACLWQGSIDYNEPLIISGWGTTENASASDVLREGKINLIDKSSCQRLFQPTRALPNGIVQEQFCAGDRQQSIDTCRGDSGGPLQIQRNQCIFYIAGITSFGKNCGQSGVYTNVTEYITWIENKVWPNQ